MCDEAFNNINGMIFNNDHRNIMHHDNCDTLILIFFF